jgi:hypothetical protein
MKATIPRRDGRLVAPSADVYVPYAPQGDVIRQYHLAEEQNRIIIGPLGSGKTQASIWEVLSQIDSQAPMADGVRRSRWAAVRNTYPDLLTTTIKDFKAWVDPLLIGKFAMGGLEPPNWKCRYRKGDGTIVEAEVLFLAFDRPDDVRKARGLQLTGLWLNEVKELAKPNVDMLMGRVRRYPGRIVEDARYSVIGDSNAPERDHWLAKLALDEKPAGWWFGIQPGPCARWAGAGS